MLKLSVIAPACNEAGNIIPFWERTRAALDSAAGTAPWQILFVNDGSLDGTLAEIQQVRAKDPRVKVLTLSRNFGYHAALVAGLTLAQSELYAIIDVDGEDPPELLPRFHQAILEGHELAYGVRSQRDEPRTITWMRSLFYRINRSIADSPTVLWMAEFSMMTRQVRDAILAPRTTAPFLRAEMAHAGFKRTGITYVRARRRNGHSHYNFFKLFKFALAAFLSSSTFPLRLIPYVAATLAVGFPLAALLFSWSLDQAVKVSMLLLFYFGLLSLATLALYLARDYKNGIARPLFIVDQTQTFLD